MDEVVVLSLAALAIILMKNKKKRPKRLWQRQWVERRNEERGVLSMVHQELKYEDQQSFKNYLRMDEDCFDKLLSIIKDKITRVDTCMRPAISANRRLSVTLRYLATGSTLKELSYSTRIPHNTISVITTEVLNAIVECMQEEYLKPPNTVDEWLTIANDFYQKWNFPNCLGALDGKHITFRPLRSAGSFYRNYKGTDSIVLLALVSADYKFLLVDIGTNGRISDGGVFSRSAISGVLENNALNFPSETPLPGRNKPVPYVVVADDAFPLKEYVMKPYRWRGLSNQQQIYNYRLSRARRTVENAFGILSNRFRILLNPINARVEKVQIITKAACILHNFLIKSSHNYLSVEDEIVDCSLSQIARQGGNRTANNPQTIREEFQEYFVGNGRVEWQDEAVGRNMPQHKNSLHAFI